MYKDIETETSYKYLKLVISKLEEPVCILGGWAVFFTVNENYQNQTSRVYIGSRDIDVGFRNAESFERAARILEQELHFRFVSFRYYNEVHAETGRDLPQTEARSLPSHMIFPVYVDLIMPYVDEETKAKLGFVPIDEPLLGKVFDGGEKYAKPVEEFGRALLLPVPEILLATKINSTVLRDKEHKRYKDVCDMVALCLFGGMPIGEIIARGKSLASKERLQKFKEIDFSQDVNKCSSVLGLEANIVKSIMDRIKEN